MSEFKGVPFFRTYEINKQGKIININTGKKTEGHIVKKTGLKRTYLFHPEKKSKFSRKYIHRLLAEIFIPNPDSFKYVYHIDGDKLNNNINNLKWSLTNKKLKKKGK